MTGCKLRKEMNELGITPTELAKFSGLSGPTLHKIFNDEHVRPSTKGKAIMALKRLKAQIERQTTAITPAVQRKYAGA